MTPPPGPRATAPATCRTAQRPPRLPEGHDERAWTALLARANAGDHQALAALRTALERAGLWTVAGDLARLAEATLLAQAGALAAPCHEQLARLRRELAGERPTALERLLVERVVLGWLALHVVEVSYAQQLGRGMSAAVDAGYQRRLAAAQGRYLAAIKALAQVRRLLTPAVQVHIAQQQVVVQEAGGGEPGEAGAAAGSSAPAVPERAMATRRIAGPRI
jgi:hypothetical protein